MRMGREMVDVFCEKKIFKFWLMFLLKPILQNGPYHYKKETGNHTSTYSEWLSFQSLEIQTHFLNPHTHTDFYTAVLVRT